MRNGKYLENGLNKDSLVTSIPLKPAGIDFFDKLSASDSDAVILKEIIYEPGLQSVPDDFVSVKNAYEEQEVQMGFALFLCDMSPELARAAGLMIADRNIKAGERYVYSISPANTPGNLNIQPAVIVVDPAELTVLPEIEDVGAIFSDRVVKFRWPVIFHKGIYSAYIIEKSFDGKKFEAISDLPLVNFSQDENQEHFLYTDSLTSNNVQVNYRISGISPFGETGPYSRLITGKGTPEFSAYAVIDSAMVVENNNIRIMWRISEDIKLPITGINVLRAGKYDGQYEKLNKKPLNGKTRFFNDDKPLYANYYKIEITSGDLSSYSFPYFVQTEDTEPPVPPQFLTGAIDSAGFVTLAWKSNPEPDLLGYKVFRSNRIDGDYISTDGGIVKTNSYLDSVNLNTLSRNVYYRVIAIDLNYNNSDFSAITELSRPDTIAPAPAIITEAVSLSGLVTLAFGQSPSNDAAFFELYCCEEDDTNAFLKKSWTKVLPGKYEDKPDAGGQTLQYTLITKDHNGNKSQSSYRLYVQPISSNPIKLNGEQSADGRIITLRWEIPPGFDPVKTIIYRSTGKDQLTLYHTTNEANTFFEDKNAGMNTGYHYQVVLFNKKGFISSEKFVFEPGVKQK